ncbi:3'(2'),5'-bisphosphate nucleotidase CysQ [Phenylobacterium sp.]|jgi:myo-inositol-1(or 4)-monophosphatase|uniref:3'(2'),5'-bisphosphate nucleotidase CysQ n=1 Tax=Phenylobacterium sp. TaxID=1871053 RepID=UPI002F953E65
MTTAAEDLALIAEAAREAGELAAELRLKGLQIDYKAGNSPVTNADLAADALLKYRLGQARPEYGWLSEETADDPLRLGRQRLFVVDPIDGTRAFLNDRPWWAVSIAVVEGERPIAGVVFAPQLHETYTAAAGAGAELNGTAIAVSGASALENCGMAGDPRLFEHPAWPIPWPAMRVEQRNSTAYRMCLVASGVFDAAVAPVPKHDWDLAAADLIASEAGAFVGDHTGRPFRYNGSKPVQASLICAAPALAPLILDRVRHIAEPK